MAWKRSIFNNRRIRKTGLDFISEKMLFTSLMLIGFILLLVPQAWTNKFQFAFASVFRVPLQIGNSYSLSRTVQQNINTQISENETALVNQVKDLLQALKEANEKIELLSGVREYIPLVKADLPIAGVITTTISDSRSDLIIYIKSNDETYKIEVGQYVMAYNSIIGTISQVANDRARVKLFTDPDSKIPVSIGDLGVSRIMEGNGNNSAKILDMQITHENSIEVGDDVYAIQKAGYLDSPMIIGKVVNSRRNTREPSILDITVEPACDVSSLDEVIVIIMNPNK